jgi:hypothetical protein
MVSEVLRLPSADGKAGVLSMRRAFLAQLNLYAALRAAL